MTVEMTTAGRHRQPAYELADMTSQLVRCQPLAGSPGQGRALRLLESWLRSSADVLEIFSFTDEGIAHDSGYVDLRQFGPQFADYGDKPREGLSAVLEFDAPGPEIVLNGHVDVEFVANPENWQQIEGSHSGKMTPDGWVLGRGAVDMLGGVASMVQAARNLHAIRETLGGRLVLQFVVDEELGGNGTLRAVKNHLERPDLAIICEPSENRVCTRTRSFQQFDVACFGTPRHMTQSRSHENAVWVAAQVVCALEELNQWCVETMRETVTSRYLCAGRIEGGGDPSLPAASCVVTVTAALPTGLAMPALLSRLDGLIRGRLPDDAIPPKITEREFNVPASALLDGAVARRAHAQLVSLAGDASSDSEFASACDARVYERIGIPTIVFGPGELHAAHSDNERIRVEDIVSHCAALTEMLADVLARTS